MLVSINWLQDFFKDPLPKAEEIARVLTMHSNEVESIEEINLPSGVKDTVLDFKVLPNRAADLLCHYGLAKELAVLTNRPLKPRPPNFEGKSGLFTKDYITLSIEARDICRRATKRYVENVKVGPSPEWLIDRLFAMNQRSINNIVDITNYVMFSYGQSGHAFDYDKLDGDQNKKDIVIREGKRGESITTLDGQVYNLYGNIGVISDGNNALDVAGIKGGDYSKIDSGTSRVLLSCCSFDPISIRRTSQKLNLRTEASKRFENNLAEEQVMLGMEELSRLVAEITGGTVAEDVLDVFPSPRSKQVLRTTAQNVVNTMGIDIRAHEIENILDRFKTHASWQWKKEKDVYEISVPYERSDMYEQKGLAKYASGVEADLIEEIARVYGYENLPGILPVEMERQAILPSYYWSERLRNIFIREGFSEVMTYSFVDKRSTGSVRVENPIASDKPYLRHSLKPAILEKLDWNRTYKDILGIEQVKIFEIGHVFNENNESVQLAFGIEDVGKGYDARAVAEIMISDLQHEFGLQSIKYDILKGTTHGVIEFEIQQIIGSLPNPEPGDILPPQNEISARYIKSSQYPFVVRDIAVWTEGERSVLEQLIKDDGDELLVSIKLFDTFKKEGGNKVSYAYRLVFQSSDRTLTNEEVDMVMKNIKEKVERKGWTVR
ncbi:MAG: hypothetical protein COV07_04185 [Candidatus Vogelbacteria bacterium CG10_big_fil_rev_8_21_14_0_10_45_14]|uniref:phenylalanine--tRNA ligase n=1 Tax=Candidatus Vogelbacteria bacterium CG10_big_fil_rev_8_21_14_0_10_45_14 TaxID=1975042 RepID=A0A2H0RIW8_9BACT|nr:MAG: hypothetical protein COV07_04185 [Candidatus Vogelbacteria bacterium CG10_big_fil_rev_8_21_14_0_10_45_14]